VAELTTAVAAVVERPAAGYHRAMATPWEPLLRRWQNAGLIDPARATAIREWEAAQAPATTLQAPVRIALALGAALLASGVLLFVSANWDGMGPTARFSLLLAVLAASHGSAVAVTSRFPALATALHAVGSVALGAGIFLAGQMFHLEAAWPQGLLLWAIGAGLGWVLLRQWPQLALLALLGPAWLLAEWTVQVEAQRPPDAFPAAALSQIPTTGLALLCLAGLAAAPGAERSPARRVLLWLGGLWLLPAAVARSVGLGALPAGPPGWAPAGLLLPGWAVAIGLPLLLTWRLRPSSLAPMGLATAWLLLQEPLYRLSAAPAWRSLIPYLWWAISGLLLVAWGLRDGRAERINFGIAALAATLLAFYGSEVMDKLGRSASLAGLGLLFLLGGWGLERLRRRLLSRLRIPPAATAP
jgi:hypothetical protein